MKKIILGAGFLALASTTFAMGGNISGSASTGVDDNLMGGFDDLINEVKTTKTTLKDKADKNIYCTLEYAPVCAFNGKIKKTYGNSCEAKKAGAKIEYKGKCKDAKSVDDKYRRLPPVQINSTKTSVEINSKNKKIKAGYNTGITGGITGINNKIPVIMEDKNEEGSLG